MLGFTSQLLIFEDGYVEDVPVVRVCKTDLVKEDLFTSENCWSDDTIWNLRITNKCNRIVVIDRIWYLYLLNNKLYWQMLYNIAFENDSRVSHRVSKQIMRLSLMRNLDRLSYMLWMLLIKWYP